MADLGQATFLVSSAAVHSLPGGLPIPDEGEEETEHEEEEDEEEEEEEEESEPKRGISGRRIGRLGVSRRLGGL